MMKTRHIVTLLIVVSALSMVVGPINILSDLNNNFFVLTEIRIPRTMLAALGGAALSLSGAVYQVVLQNRMADSFTLGMANGATLGAFFAISLGLPLVFISLFGITTGLLTLLIVLFIARRLNHKYTPATLIITGILLGSLFSGLLYIFILFQPDKTNHLLSFMFGSFGNANIYHCLIVGILFFGSLIYALKNARQLDFFLLGELRAHSLGVNVRRMRFMMLIILSLAPLALISFTGIIGLVGIIVPQVLQFFKPMKTRELLKKSALFGSIFLVTADTLGRVVLMPYTVPTGIIVMLSSVPIIFILLYKRMIRMT